MIKALNRCVHKALDHALDEIDHRQSDLDDQCCLIGWEISKHIREIDTRANYAQLERHAVRCTLDTFAIRFDESPPRVVSLREICGDALNMSVLKEHLVSAELELVKKYSAILDAIAEERALLHESSSRISRYLTDVFRSEIRLEHLDLTKVLRKRWTKKTNEVRERESRS